MIQKWQRFGLLSGTLWLSLGLALNMGMPVRAVTTDDLNSNLQKEQDLKSKISNTKGQEQTLQNQIAQMDNQISLNELEIQDTQGQIQSTQDLLTQVNSNINDVSTKLGRLDDTVTKLQQSADARIREAYKMSRVPAVGAIVAAQNFQDALTNFQYIKQLEDQDAKLLSQIDDNRKNYQAQVDNLNKLKAQKEQLVSGLQQKQQLAQVQQQELSDAKSSKNDLLSATQNSEANYQRLLSETEAEIAIMRYQLQQGLRSGQYLGHFTRGEPIAYAGETGCATGPHVHFGYYTNANSTSSYINPTPLINNGTLGWPTGSPAPITQPFLGAAHNGIDFGVPLGSTLYATREGDAYLKITPKSVIIAQGWCGYNGDYGWVKVTPKTDQQEVWLIHSDGSMSLYAHVSGVIVK